MTTQMFSSFEEFQAREDKGVNGVSCESRFDNPDGEARNETNCTDGTNLTGPKEA